MEAVIYQQNIDPLPIEKNNPEIIPQEGILNTEYKRIAKHNLSGSANNSIHAVRKQVRRSQFRMVGEVDTLLKIALFVIAIAIALL